MVWTIQIFGRRGIGEFLKSRRTGQDEVHTFCDPEWQSQPMIDHNLYIKYLETEKLTLTRELKLLFTTQFDTTRDDTYTLYVAILP